MSKVIRHPQDGTLYFSEIQDPETWDSPNPAFECASHAEALKAAEFCNRLIREVKVETLERAALEAEIFPICLVENAVGCTGNLIAAEIRSLKYD